MTEQKYTIKQLSSLTKTSQHTLRYYESIGLILGVERAANNHRRYSDCDLRWIEFLQQLKTTGMPLEQMREYAELRREGDCTIKDRRRMLELHRLNTLKKIEALHKHLEIIDDKIDVHRKKEQQIHRKNS